MKACNEPAVEVSGYEPGALGRIIEAHAVYYHEHWGFDISFEVQEARELAEFLGRYRKERDGLWVARVDRRFAGAIAIDGGPVGTQDGARLRWFIVPQEFQGCGIGTMLIRKAVEFCRAAGHHKVFLWTFHGLESARHLYERAGFRLALQREVHQWGQVILEQKFELTLGPD
jgi:GNAT superfamily N-acetyltransferase